LNPGLDASTCSNAASGRNLSVTAGSVAATSYNITNIDADPGLVPDAGNATAGNGQSSNAISGDIFSNPTTGSLTVVYDIVPVSAVGCGGDMVQVTLTVYPGPVLDPNLDATVCSEEAGGIVLDIAAGSIAVANYNITNINVANGLVAYIGNATAGNGKPANEIESDKFTNTSSTAKTVVYDIVPVGITGCEGDMVQVTLTVNPEPVIDPGLNTTTCSDVAGGIILDVASGSVAAAGYNIT
ncbi:unnamed protein product, partial [marine sediment metagenome]